MQNPTLRQFILRGSVHFPLINMLKNESIPLGTFPLMIRTA